MDTKAIGRPEKLRGNLEEASRSWRQSNYAPERMMEFNRQIAVVVVGTLTVNISSDIAVNSSPGSGLDMCEGSTAVEGTDPPKSCLGRGRPFPAIERWEDQRRR